MKRMEEVFMLYPFYGSRQMTYHLRREGLSVGGHRIRRLMRVITEWGDFYNTIRPHSSLDGSTPHEAYWQSRKQFYDMGLIPCHKAQEMAA